MDGREGFCSWVKDGRIFVVGGKDAEDQMRGEWVLAERELKGGKGWTARGGKVPAGLSRTSAGCAVDGGKVFVFGGMSLDEEQMWLNDVCVLDLEKGEWKIVRAKGEVPSIRAHPMVCVLGKEKRFVVVFGGFGPVDPEEDEEECPPEKKARVEEDEDEEDDEDENAISFSWFDDCYAFDTAAMRWRKVKVAGEPPVGRCAGSLTAVAESEAVLFGGRTKLGARTNDVWKMIFDESRMEVSFSEVAVSGDAPEGRSYHSAVFHEGNLYIHGGLNDSETYLKDMFKLSLAEGKWTELSQPSLRPRAMHCAHIVDGKMYIYGGGAVYNPEFNGSESLHDNSIVEVAL